MKNQRLLEISEWAFLATATLGCLMTLRVAIYQFAVPYPPGLAVQIINPRAVTASASNTAVSRGGIAAVAMSSRIGETFDAIITGVTSHGTFVRVLKPTVEGLLAQGQQGADVGDKLRVKLIRTDIQRGYIDFARD